MPEPGAGDDLLTREFTGPLAVVRGARGWITESAPFTIGSSVGGDRVRLEVGGAQVPGLGAISANVDIPGPRRTIQIADERFEVLVAELEVRPLHAEGEPIEAFGFRLAATPSPVAKVAWMTQIFVGSPAARPFVEELRAAAARPPLEPWTAETVTIHLAQRLRATFPECTFADAGSLTLRYTGPGKLEGSLALENLWANVKDEPSRLAKAVKDRISSFKDMLAPDTATRTQVFVSVKSTAQVEHQREVLSTREGARDDIIAERIAGDAWALYVLDRPMTIETLRASTLESLGLSRADLPGVAAENLWRSHEAFQVHGVPGRTHHMVTCGGNYEASLLTLPGFWRSIESIIGSKYVAATPTRDILLIAPLNLPESVEKIRALARQIHASGSYPISDQLLTMRGGAWHVHEG